MRTFILALAASGLLAAVPAMAKSPYDTPPGKTPKVCLLTFSTDQTLGTRGADADVVKAQYVPLAIAMKLEARNDSYADIYTYNETSLATGVDYNVVGGADPALGIEADMGTEEVCGLFQDFAGDQDDDD